MDNITYVTDEQGTEHVVIDRGNGEFTSMTKAHYEELQAANMEKPTTKK